MFDWTILKYQQSQLAAPPARTVSICVPETVFMLGHYSTVLIVHLCFPCFLMPSRVLVLELVQEYLLRQLQILKGNWVSIIFVIALSK